MPPGVQPPIDAVRRAVARALEEDLTPLGDITSSLLPEGVVGEADFVVRTPGVLAGCSCASEAFAQVDATVVVDWAATDGDDVDAKQVIGHVSGPLASILTSERTALNFLGHLSGIATLTRELVRGAFRRCGDAPVVEQVAFRTSSGRRFSVLGAVQADHGLRVANVDGQQHSGRHLDVEPDVEHGR